MIRPQPSGALLEMLERAGELDRIMERGLTFDRTPAPPAPPPGPSIYEILQSDRPDWRREEAEAVERERQEHARAIAAEVEKLEDTDPRPAPKQRRGWRA